MQKLVLFCKQTAKKLVLHEIQGLMEAIPCTMQLRGALIKQLLCFLHMEVSVIG